MVANVDQVDDNENWALSPGNAGMERQTLALFDSMGISQRIIRVRPRKPWTLLPPGLWPLPLAALREDSDQISAPWPRLVVSCGRRAVPYALYIKKQSANKTLLVHIQNPQTDIKKFDLVIAPIHDRLNGQNVIQTVAALHNINDQKLTFEAKKFEDRLSYLPKMKVTVLVGGSNKCYRLDIETISQLAAQLRQLVNKFEVGLLITPSRRTGKSNMAALRKGLNGIPSEIWDFQGPNPYLAYLGQADAIIVTSDSINMVSEACATGKPVYVFQLGKGNRKFSEFHKRMRDRGYTRTFRGSLEKWDYVPPNDTIRATQKVLDLLKKA